MKRFGLVLSGFVIAATLAATPAQAADNGFGDDPAKTGWFSVASYKAFGPDASAGDPSLVAGATPGQADPSSLNAIKPASGAPKADPVRPDPSR